MDTIDILKTHNAWRRGDDTRTQCELGFSVTELGIAIDDAVRAISERDQLRAELEECVRAWSLANADVKALRAELAQERERVKSLAFALDQAKTSMLDSGYSPSSVVIRACNSALSAGEGGE